MNNCELYIDYTHSRFLLISLRNLLYNSFKLRNIYKQTSTVIYNRPLETKAFQARISNLIYRQLTRHVFKLQYILPKEGGGGVSPFTTKQNTAARVFM